MRKPPEWVSKLPAGQYETPELIAITGLASTTIAKVLRKYGVKVKKVPSGYKNLQKNIFIWNGVKE